VQGCFALVAGRLGDIYSLRSAYLLGITFCTVWIAISGFMPVSAPRVASLTHQNIIGLSFARALAGVGFAVASPAAAGIVGTSFPQGKPRNMTFAAIAGAGAIGAGLGWLTGGVLAEATRWVCTPTTR
jgi:MFS family permease